jgi:hypothetical protein
MRARSFVILAAALAALPVAGCDDGPTENSPDIIVENGSSVSISQVHIRDCPVKFWGENRLDPGEVIAPGERRRFPVEFECVDVLVYFDTERTTDRHGLEVPRGASAVWTVPDAAF